ncbi:protein trichome birefringence-like 19 [Coffea eugenioides]|uniref:Protein trichome birefringence-like 19 n=1 Tax=Coffea arabica TaxID=13443 RepID=A0A6P6THX8_COFAR|nr:protein trichome birefringence-like 19 [Coffea arabica]XP_027152669.1 protein trichome birefringence-like 19 [Coffea eugenioides]
MDQAAFVKSNSVQRAPMILPIAVTVTALVILAILPIYYPLRRYPSQAVVKIAASPPYHSAQKLIKAVEDEEKCDIFTGEWIPNPNAPYYTNATCWAIHEHQNCMKYGRPDDGFMKWKWKPEGCDLPIFNPYQFLDIVRGKSMAFVGDSIGRNHMQSLICLLSRVEFPIDDSATDDDYFRRWKYPSYNFTLAAFWSPFLVRFQKPGAADLFDLYLDESDEKWSTQIEGFDYVILNAGQWYFRPSMYYEKRRLVGCRFCQLGNIIDLPMTYGYRRALRTAFRAINSLKNYRGITFLRTYAPSHFENGEWNKGGNCLRKRPFWSNETALEANNLEVYLTQMEEFRAAEWEGKKKGLRYRLLDVTQAMLLRPDGHPSRYGHWPHENVTLYNDCVHWCLPGPIDSWSDFLLHMLKMEGRRSHEEKLQPQTQ